MGFWDWFAACRAEYAAKKDKARFKLTEYYQAAYDYRETDPDFAFELLSDARQLAEQLGEPWWALFYDKFRIDALIHFKRDFRDVLDLAVKCALEVRKPQYEQFPARFGVYDSLVASYLGIDAEGYAGKIQEALDYLDKEIPPGPESDRFLMLARKRIFALELNQNDRASDACLEELNLCDAADEGTALHFSVFVYCALCQIAHRQGNWKALAEYARTGEELAQKKGHQCELSELIAWQAAVHQRGGRPDEAQRYFRKATSKASKLGMPPKSGFFDALAAFYDMQDDLPGVLKVRDQELESILDHGRHLYETRVRLERCRLLRQMRAPVEEEVEAAREVARKLRKPEKHLEALEAV